MTTPADPSAALTAARASGLILAGEPLLTMLSGGADSICLLDVALALDARVTALHVNYGLRDEADGDERHCRELCEELGVELIVERVVLPETGNLHAQARDARYRLAERHATGDYATAHTLSDQAETVLYRLAVSPGRRPLLGMEPRRGRLIRPLLGATAAETRVHCKARELTWREDASNADPRFARARVRHGLLAQLRDIAPSAERTIAETAAQLREEAEALDAATTAALDRLGGGPAVEAAALAELGPALARLVLRRLAEREVGGPHPLTRADVDAVLALSGGTRTLDLGAGLRAIAEYGTVRFQVGPEAPAPEPVALGIPGEARFGRWQLRATAGGGGEVELDAATLSDTVTVRGWRDSDRIRPVGLGGTKTLQDLFTDRKVPRELRRSLPIVEADGEIAWVAGLAVGERFAPTEATSERVGLSARLM